MKTKMILSLSVFAFLASCVNPIPWSWSRQELSHIKEGLAPANIRGYVITLYDQDGKEVEKFDFKGGSTHISYKPKIYYNFFFNLGIKEYRYYHKKSANCAQVMRTRDYHAPTIQISSGYGSYGYTLYFDGPSGGVYEHSYAFREIVTQAAHDILINPLSKGHFTIQKR